MRVYKVLTPTVVLMLAAAVAAVVANATPILQTNDACYTVGEQVQITGSGFAPGRVYQVSVDGLDFGTSTTNASGGFTASLRPGGLGANVVQAVHILAASDGTSETRTEFTVTRKTGARVLAHPGAPITAHSPFQVWGFVLESVQAPGYTPYGTRVPVYLHYIGPHKHLKRTIMLGHTGGQCGYLKTKALRLFPFTPGSGTWTLQIDTSRTYSKHPVGPRAKIIVHVS